MNSKTNLHHPEKLGYQSQDREEDFWLLADMRLLLEYQLQRKRLIDWELWDEYFSLFNKQALLATLKKDFS